MSEQVSITPIPRPPTPPREANTSGNLLYLERVLQKHLPQPTSNGTPQAKKVGWTESTEYDDVPIHPANNHSSPQSSLQHLPPSADRKPVKSILKASTRLQAPHKYPSFATMLESIIQQLAGKDRTSKIDSYDTLSQVLKASDGVPDLEALREKMGLLQQFIKRDCCATTVYGMPDTGLMVRALTLLCSFLYKKAISDTLTVDFTAAMVDHAIKALEDPEISKEVAKYLMFVVAEQSFPARTMSTDRVSRVIAALHNLNNHTKLIKGKSIAIGRINIYRRLSRQSREKMLPNTDWLKDVLTSMISDSIEVRSAAISFGYEASLIFGTEGKTSRVLMEIFHAETETCPGLNFMSIYQEHLKKMIRDKEQSANVPRIWSIVVLFLRCRPLQFEQWVFMKNWLKIIQDCFNCGESQTKIEANHAWNRLVFVTKLDHKTPLKTITMLRMPLIEQLKRRDRKAAKMRKAALSSIYTLLYYGLRPDATSEQLDLYWKELVVEFIAALNPNDISSNRDLAQQDIADACRILDVLFDSSTPRVWHEEGFVEQLENASVGVKELPAIDPRWLRKSYTIVFPVLESILEKLYCDLDDISTILSTWKSYIASIASAAVKEIKVSNDAMACVAQILNFLFKTWLRGPSNLQGGANLQHLNPLVFLRNFETVISTTIEGLGVLPFTERLLSMSSQLQFIVIATPSQRPVKTPGEIRSPLHHLFVLLTTPSPGLAYDGNFSNLVRRILSPFFAARASGKAQVELAKDLLKLLPQYGSDQSRALWRVLADFSTTAVDTRDESAAAGNNDQPLGAHYRNIVKILEVGIELSPSDGLPGWKGLFHAAVNSATLDAGDAGRATTLIEPLSRFLLSQDAGLKDSSTTCALSYCHMLLSKAAYPKDRQALDAARKRLWGTANASSKNGTFDPYDQFYEYVRHYLEVSYATFNSSQAYAHVNIIATTTALLSHCPHALLLKALTRLQSGLRCWIEDSKTQLVGFKALSESVTKLWATICSFVSGISSLHTYPKILSELEPLISAGLESKHKTTINTAILLWNSTFGTSQDKLEYSDRLQKAIMRLRLISDLQLPFFPESPEFEEQIEGGQPIIFVDSQDEDFIDISANNDPRFDIHPRSQMNSSPLRRILRETTPQVVIPSSGLVSGKRAHEATPEMGKKKARKMENTPSLRHNDSQIQFQTIDSSPDGNTSLDSQLLTERQKEVKERQLAEAALFPDLRSSPRIRSSIRREEDMDFELPLHRSSSKLRKMISPRPERQTTPTIGTTGEEDNFMTSSPTPTRSLSAAFDKFDPPSSPPTAVREVSHGEISHLQNDMVILSSPPEKPREFADDTTTSLDPSAQIDPDAAGHHVSSTFEDTSSKIGDTTMPNTSSALEPSDVIKASSPAIINAANEAVDPESVEDSSGEKIERPSTPKHAASHELHPVQSPKTPNEVFVDALSSPVLSDNVFQDAVSSLRLNFGSAALEVLSPSSSELSELLEDEKSSPPFSELDESSMLRVMNGIDKGIGVDPMRSSDEIQSKTEPAHSSSSKNSLQTPKSRDVQVRSRGKKSSPAIQAPQPSSTKAPSSDQAPKHSSIPSLIPETPFRNPEMAPIIDEDEDSGTFSTIIVDPDAGDMPSKRRARSVPKRTPSTHKSSRKRKSLELENDVPDDQSEVPDSQDVKSYVPVRKRSLKKQSERPTRTSKRAKRTARSHGLASAPSLRSTHNVSSTDPDSPIPEAEGEDTSGAVEAEAQEDDFSNSQRDLDAQIFKDRRQQELPQTADPEIEHEDASISQIEQDVPKVEELEIMAVAKEVTIDEAAVSDIYLKTQPSPTAALEILNEKTLEQELVFSTGSGIPSSAPAVFDNSVLAQEAVDYSNPAETVTAVEVVTADSIKDKLSSLIDDLGGAKLTRDEVNAFEDLFMDAKEMLYGAARRGRQA